MPAMRAKVKCDAVTLRDGYEVLEFVAVCKAGSYPADGADEDNTYAKFSPSASFKLTVANPALFGQLKPGQKFYVDFTEAPNEGPVHDVHTDAKLGPPEPDGLPSAADSDGADDQVEELAEAYDFEENSRKWLRAIAPIITAGYSTETNVDRRVQYALDLLVIAACERAARIMRSDLPPVEP